MGALMDSPLFRKPKKPKKKKIILPGLLGACTNKCNIIEDEKAMNACADKCKLDEIAKSAKSEYDMAKSNLDD